MIWVVVSGSREHDKREAIWFKLDECAGAFGYDGMVLVTGDCPKGADLHAINWGKARGVAHFDWPAPWRRMGRKAGQVRNRRMLEWVAQRKNRMVLAFPKGESPGTRGAIKIAGELDLHTETYEYEEL